LIEDITERGRRLASESPMGRLDPPLLLLLDEVANIAPLPSLPSLLADGGGVGLPTVAVLQSLAQARSRWGIADAEAMWDASTIKIVLGGLGQADDLSQLSRILGERPRRPLAGVNDVGRPVTAIDELRTMPFGRALLLHRASLPVRLSL
jgi:hypothetical protein